MAITYPLTMPATPAPNEVSYELINSVGSVESPFTGTQQVFEWPAEIILISYKFPPMTRATAAVWLAFLAALRGKVGTFYAGVQGNEKTARGLGQYGGTPLVNGTNTAQSKVLNVKGFGPNFVGVVKAGDWFQVGTRLFMSLTDKDADGSGNCTVDIFPRLRENRTDGESVVFASPKGLFRLKDNSRKVTINHLQHFGFTLDCREAL